MDGLTVLVRDVLNWSWAGKVVVVDHRGLCGVVEQEDMVQARILRGRGFCAQRGKPWLCPTRLSNGERHGQYDGYAINSVTRRMGL
jgi:hypothetical protein